ncbi:MAG: type VI secretion system tip protein VgrG [Nannocystis sp.]|nr:type VI secretion system tip protein TssI/VgrG [Nannocystis sp.]MBA3546545.1 type VI secretion system tip protein VgrG [Nannocystis sp.]
MSKSETPAEFAQGILSAVRYHFSARGPANVPWQLRRFSLQESLSEPYRLELELWTTDHEAVPARLLGDSCTLAIERDGHGRHVHGIIHRVDMLPMAFDQVRVRVSVGPALELLAYRRNTRFWQDRSVLQILDEVLRPALAGYGRKFELRVDAAAFRPREYCVQFRETDLEFATRLMHESGIVYAFEHEQGDAERLVLHDSTTHAEDLGASKLLYSPAGGGVATRQSLESLDWSCRLGATSVVQRDWAWKAVPPGPLLHEGRGLDGRHRERERYDHDDHRLDHDDGAARVKDKLEAELSAAESGHGAGDVLEMVPGRCFEVQFHPALEQGGRYLLVTVMHTGDVPELATDSQQQAEGPRYRNEFRCIPAQVAYCGPPPPPRQRVHGPQTAIVVGPDNHDDIHTDEHGRIRVLFHWDRISPHDETASCWIRVAQSLAGIGWGHQFIPRIGMEVLVEFLDGDPDRPMVVGCVYNGLNRPPFTLPDKKTQSGIKTESSPGGGGSNELRFEDARGQEEIWLHAQKDLKAKVEHDHGTSVGRNQSNSVGGDQTETIRGEQKLSIKGNRTVSIAGSQSVDIEGGAPVEGVSGSRLNITGDYKVNASGTIDFTSPLGIRLFCGKTSLYLTPDSITLAAGGQAFLVLNTNALLQASGGASVLLDGEVYTKASEGAFLLMNANVLVGAHEGAQILLDDNAAMTSKDGSQVMLDAGATVSGHLTAKITAPNTSLEGGENQVIAGDGEMVITGGMLRHN